MIFDHIGLLLALVGLAATLAVAIARPPWLSEAVAAVVASATVIATGAVSLEGARQAAGDLAPTIGFLATLLLLASGCRREGLFDALGSIMARNARDSPHRLLALVFVVSASVTAVLGLDSTIVLLTPVVFATATRLRMNPQATRLRVLASGELCVVAAAGLQPHESARLPCQRSVVRALCRVHGCTDGGWDRSGMGSS